MCNAAAFNNTSAAWFAVYRRCSAIPASVLWCSRLLGDNCGWPAALWWRRRREHRGVGGGDRQAAVALAYRPRLERPQTYILDGHQYRLTVASDLVLR